MHAAPSAEPSRALPAGLRALRTATARVRKGLAPLASGWLVVVLVAWLALVFAPDTWDRFAYVALGVGFGGLLARWLPLRQAASAPVARPFVYQPAPPPWESSTSL
jgi:hypothetical protein